VRGRGFAPKGQTPVVRVNSKRHGLSVISTVTNKGQVNEAGLITKRRCVVPPSRLDKAKRSVIESPKKTMLRGNA
jgi:hypothetical protein